MSIDIIDQDSVQADFQDGTLTDVEADAGGYLRLALAIDDDFDTFDTNVWTKFGTANGTISVGNSELTIEQTAGGGTGTNLIGVYSNVAFAPGMMIRARVKSDSKRHHTVIGIGESPWLAAPHVDPGVGVTWYAKADNLSSNTSYEDESGTTGSDSGVTQDLTSYQTIELLWKSDGSTIEFYRSGAFETSFTGLDFDANHYVYFSADGWATPNRVLVDWVEVRDITTGNRLSPQLDLLAVGTVESSSISWTETLNGETITIETRASLDGGSTWTSWAAATDGGSIPGLSAGNDVSNGLLECRQTLSTSDPTVTPELDSLTLEVDSSVAHGASLIVDALPSDEFLELENAATIYMDELPDIVNLGIDKSPVALTMDSVSSGEEMSLFNTTSLILESSALDIIEYFSNSVILTLDSMTTWKFPYWYPWTPHDYYSPIVWTPQSPPSTSWAARPKASTSWS